MTEVTVNYYEDGRKLQRMFGRIPEGKFRVLITGGGGEEDSIDDHSTLEKAQKLAKKIGCDVAIYNDRGECLFSA